MFDEMTDKIDAVTISRRIMAFPPRREAVQSRNMSFARSH